MNERWSVWAGVQGVGGGAGFGERVGGRECGRYRGAEGAEDYICGGQGDVEVRVESRGEVYMRKIIIILKRADIHMLCESV
jgi:hypothetical protein